MNLHGIAGNVIATGRFDGSKEAYYYYHKDLGGSTTNLRDAEGTSVVSYQYTDFGETEIYGNTAFYNEICYNGAIYDKSTGHYYLNARYYDPESGRFLSQDSYRGDASRPATMNLYNYCANDPLNYDDPSGHIAISRIVGGIIGGAVGYLAGRKIAKATKAKGWKKVAIIAGCTVGGAAIGALVGPKVAKVVKKAATVVKRKVASSQRLSKISNAYKKAKSGIKKTVSKAKNAVSKRKASVPKIKEKTSNIIKQQTSNQSTAIQTFYPQNNGAAGKVVKKHLMAGERIDRFGSLRGHYFSPQGTPMKMRALPPNTDLSRYTVFEVVKAFEVEVSTIAPAFNQIGLGTQYYSSVSAMDLLKHGIIKVVL